MTRYTFVVQVHPGGISTVENLATSDRVRITDVTTVGRQIARWLEELQAGDPLPASVQRDRDGGAP
jgi:hypothetical protein